MEKGLLVFDLDGVLVDFRKRDYLSFIESSQSFSGRNGLPDFKKFIQLREEGKSCLEIIELMFGETPIKFKKEFKKERKASFESLSLLKKDTVFPNAKRSLSMIRKRGYKVAIVSLRRNREGFNYSIKRFGFDRLCDIVLCRQNNTKSKTSLLKQLLKRFKLQAKNAIGVGDQIEDIAAYKSLGIKPVGITTGYVGRNRFKKNKAEFIAKDLSEIVKILQKLETQKNYRAGH